MQQDIDGEAEQRRITHHRIRRKRFRDALNPFDLPNRIFRQNFGLNKESAHALIERLTPAEPEAAPSLLQSHTWLTNIGNPQIILLSATLTQLDVSFIEATFQIRVNSILTVLEPRHNIEYAVANVTSINSFRSLHTFVKNADSVIPVTHKRLHDALSSSIVRIVMAKRAEE